MWYFIWLHYTDHRSLWMKNEAKEFPGFCYLNKLRHSYILNWCILTVSLTYPGSASIKISWFQFQKMTPINYWRKTRFFCFHYRLNVILDSTSSRRQPRSQTIFYDNDLIITWCPFEKSSDVKEVLNIIKF